MTTKGMIANERFFVGEWEVRKDLDRICRGEECVELPPQAMDLLVCLVEHQSQIVTNETLYQTLWPGRVVTRSSLYAIVKLLRQALGDDAHDPRYIQTVHKRGYCLIAEVRFSEPRSRAPVPRGQKSNSVSPLRPSSFMPIAILFALLVYYGLPDKAPPGALTNQTSIASVAVLPFADLSEQQNQGWFADGVSEEIANRLAQVPGLKVIGRESSSAFRNSDTSLRDIGRTLDVEHVLEGSVWRDDNQLQLAVQLVRTSDGQELWSHHFDRATTETIAIQENISHSIAAALELEWKHPPESAGMGTLYPSFNAYQLYLQAREHMSQFKKAELVTAIEKLQKALELEPDFVEAHVAIAGAYFQLREFSGYYVDDILAESAALARPHIDHALELDPDNAQAWVMLGNVIAWDNEEKMAAWERALELNPNLPDVYLSIGVRKGNELASWNQAVPWLEKAVEVDPLNIGTANALAGYLELLPHRNGESAMIYETLRRQFPDRADVTAHYAIWLVRHQGRLAESIPILEQLLVDDPDNRWARSTLTKAWYMLGEMDRALQSEHRSTHWYFPLSPDRETAMQELAEAPFWNRDVPPYFLVLKGYAQLMLRDWQGVVDTLGPFAGDLDAFGKLYEIGLSQSLSPATSLAVAYQKLGDEKNFQRLLDYQLEVIELVSEDGRIRNADYARTMARVNALQGREYDALLELEHLISRGMIDPRELLHPAFDALRGNPDFLRLRQVQRDRINIEREALGLEPLENVYAQLAARTDLFPESFIEPKAIAE